MSAIREIFANYLSSMDGYIIHDDGLALKALIVENLKKLINEGAKCIDDIKHFLNTKVLKTSH